jgi:hypothetical protein
VLRLAFVACALAACSSAPTGPEILSWQLADGRDCYTAGVTTVEVRASRSLATQPLAAPKCTDGLSPAAFTVPAAPGDGTLYLDGVDGLGTDLYHGELSLDSNPPGTGETRLVTLYAAAAE